MPGAKFHDATGAEEKMSSILYRIGLNAPDDLKRLSRYYDNDLQQLVNRYSQYDLSGDEKKMLPTVSQLDVLKNITHLTPPQFTEKDGKKEIVQFTDRAELEEILKGKGSKFGDLSFIDLNNPFWQGYVTHLVGDKIAYNTAKCVNMEQYILDCKDSSIGEENAKKRLHRDLDCLNQILQDKYNINILPHIKEKDIVKFVDENPKYINTDEYIRAIKTVKEITSIMDMNIIVKKVNAYLKSQNPNIEASNNAPSK